MRITGLPAHGTLNLAQNVNGADLWVTYTPTAGYAGTDSFTFRGVSPGTGPADSDELSPTRTVNLRVAPGTAPVCANLSQSVPQGVATNLRLLCASGGDPITSHAIPVTGGPGHGTVGMTAINSGLLTYTSVAGFSGADTFKYTATSTCGAASCMFKRRSTT